MGNAVERDVSRGDDGENVNLIPTLHQLTLPPPSGEAAAKTFTVSERRSSVVEPSSSSCSLTSAGFNTDLLYLYKKKLLEIELYSKVRGRKSRKIPRN